jgi:diguanylate cyclase (GGDEF)-like protein
MVFAFGYGFNRLKVFFIGIHILLLFLQINIGMFHLQTSITTIIFPFITAFNIGIILLVKDGAVLSIQGKGIALLLLTEAISLFIFYNEILYFFLKVKDLNLPAPVKVWEIPDLAVILFLMIFAVLLFHLIRHFSIEKMFLLGSIVSIFLCLPLIKKEIGAELFLTTSSIFLLLSVVYRTYAMAYIDELTNIPSRRMLKEDLMKLGNKYSIAMLDIDFFKKFNDKYGHDVGDDVLKLVAGCLVRVKGGGKAYRYGGEEFTIVFPKKEMEDVLSHLEDLREKVSNVEYLYKKESRSGTGTQKLKVTISIGIAEKEGSMKSTNEVIKAADKALYRAKKKGRNCVSK